MTGQGKETKQYEYANSVKSDRDFLVFLVLSGSGKRSSAFSYYVLEQLSSFKFVDGGKSRTLLDEIDYIFASSGASITAAYWGLFGDRIFEDFEVRFLFHDIENGLTKEILKPINLLRLYSPYFNKADLIAEYYGKHLFENQTFVNIFANKNNPKIYIGATELGTGADFVFDQAYFNLINSNLSNFSVSRAVTASLASINFHGPVTLLNHTAGVDLSQNIKYVLAKRNARHNVESDLYRKMLEHYNNIANKYIHLADIGLGGSQGLQFVINQFDTNGIINKKLNDRDNPLRRLMIINVNPDMDLFPEIPPTEKMMYTPIFTMESTMSSSVDYITARQLMKIMGYADELYRVAIKFGDTTRSLSLLEQPYIVDISFRNIQDDGIRAMCNQISSRSFNLTKEQLDLISGVVPTLVSEDPGLIRFLETLSKTKAANEQAEEKVNRGRTKLKY